MNNKKCDYKELYRDSAVIVIEKPAGITSEGENSVLSLVKSKTGIDCHLVHRLDCETGGCMVFALDSRSAADISSQIENGVFIKKYTAVAKGTFESEADTLTDMLYFDRRINKSFVCDKERKGVKYAELSYRVLDTAEDEKCTSLSLLAIKLKTGRTHQIRVQLASRKHPLIGDGKYGGGDNRCKTALWCTALSFVSPDTKKQVMVKSQMPDTFPWNIFEKSEITGEKQKCLTAE